MNRNYFFAIVAAALLCLFLIFLSLWREVASPIAKEPVIPPPEAPYVSSISGVGIVEPSTGNIYIGSPLNSIVMEVFATTGKKVKKGEPLLQFDDRDLKANLKLQQIVYEGSIAKFQRLKAFPRKDDLLIAQAACKIAKAELEQAKNQYAMLQELPDARAISLEERNRRLYQYQQAEAKNEQAEADLNKIMEGTWKPDLEIAKLEVLQAKADLNRIQTEIERTIHSNPQ